ncbi:hypothetical protein M569_00314, partial [Genlisea aurea]
CSGPRPSARSNHVAALYNDKTLFVFGGASKSKTLNDMYSLDFETMMWSRIKIKGFHPSPRAGCCGALCGTKWYITGGGSRKRRPAETLIFDVLKLEWSIAVTCPPHSITTNKGFSLVLVQHNDRDFLVAFGGTKKDPSNQVEVLIVEKVESSLIRRSTLSKVAGTLLSENAAEQVHGSLSGHFNSITRQNLSSIIEQQHGSGRKSLSESLLIDPNSSSGNVSLRRQFYNEENGSNSLSKSSEDKTSFRATLDGNLKPSGSFSSDIHVEEVVGEHPDAFPSESDDVLLQTRRSHHVYEEKIAALMKKTGILEGQLAAATAAREAAEKNSASATRSRQEMEKKLVDTLKEIDLLKEKLSSVEISQEEANNLSNIVHSDNVRLEHDVAFLKAVLDDTQKASWKQKRLELHSTRGVLAGERARAFQLQVEVFHLKQRLQSLETRAPTPRKQFH